MIDLDELEGLCKEATAGPWYPLVGHPYLFANMRGPEPWHHDIVGRFDYHSEKDRAFIAALRNNAEELIAMAKRYQWLRDGNNDLEGLVPLVSGDDLDAAIDAAMEQKPSEAQMFGMDLWGGGVP